MLFLLYLDKISDVLLEYVKHWTDDPTDETSDDPDDDSDTK